VSITGPENPAETTVIEFRMMQNFSVMSFDNFGGSRGDIESLEGQHVKVSRRWRLIRRMSWPVSTPQEEPRALTVA
jgi:hypothetical protein